MGKVYEQIDATLAAWMTAQPLWFIATAPLAADGLVNLSPRGHDTFSVLDPLTVGWVDLTGSGVETIAHLRENGRICLLFASFDTRPRLVRLHGRGRVCLADDPLYTQVVSAHPPHPATRAVIVVEVDRVSDSCGYGVPVMELVGERDLLRLNAVKRGPEGLQAYRDENNAYSLDGLPGL
jgi:hypothetical protein